MNHTHNKSRRRPRRLPSRRAGFTLVEMLVAVALVLLLMSMFAQVFQIAGSTMSKQRGIAENDQRSRTLQNIIKGDLDKRTFRLVVPWVNQENGQLPEADGPLRQGYLYISENDPASETDDFLQLTVSANVITKQKDFEPFTGKATLVGSQGLADPTDQGQRNRLLYDEPNQPEADDGRTTLEDGTATSSAAEIAYFLRNGNLYRRVLLIREPLPSVGAADAQPRFKANNNTLWDAFDYTTSPDPGVPPSYPATGNFWNDFDFSAFPQPCSGDSTLYYARFHGIDDLNNASTNTQFPFGRPNWRFGHNTTTGRSREWNAASSAATFYVGRLTHEETSRSNINYPHGVNSGINPMSATYADADNDGVVDPPISGPRRGEDLLLPNVHAFDIKVWDDGANRFVDIGGLGAVYFNPTNYRLTGSGGPTFGPVGVAGVDNVLDTWYPGPENSADSSLAGLWLDYDADSNRDSGETNLPPPYRLRTFKPQNEHIDTTDTTPNTLPNGATAIIPNWQNNNPYSIGDRVFPPYFPPGDINEGQSRLPRNTRFFYRMVGFNGTSGPTALSGANLTNQPTWPTAAGARVVDNECVWEAVDNWRPLKAIQITVRFFDIPSDQMRQVTIVHNLVD